MYVCIHTHTHTHVVHTRVSDENKRKRRRGWIAAFIIIWKGATIRERVRPVPANIRREKERNGEKRFRHCTFLQSAAPGYSGCTPLPFSHFSLPPAPPAFLLLLLLRAALLLFPGRISILIFFHPFFFHVRTSVISSSSFFPSANPFSLPSPSLSLSPFHVRTTLVPPSTPKEVIFLDLACGLRSSVTKEVRRGKAWRTGRIFLQFRYAPCFHALSVRLTLFIPPPTPFVRRLTRLSWSTGTPLHPLRIFRYFLSPFNFLWFFSRVHSFREGLRNAWIVWKLRENSAGCFIGRLGS